MVVKAKKHLGQHFLTDENIAKKIVHALEVKDEENVVEVGPGTGVLTRYLLKKNATVFLAEIDKDSIEYLLENYTSQISPRCFIGDFLKTNFNFAQGKQIKIIGNFPYNISSQILFKILDYQTQIPEVVGMFQKEVAERVSSLPKTKSYGILSVLIQARYRVEYLFTVGERVFSPPPKVKSGVIRLTRTSQKNIEEVDTLFRSIVRTGFNQRRKKLSNSLKTLQIPEHILSHPFLEKRAEELSVEDFVSLSRTWKNAL
ncbi:MAG: 16S rRNA (adenine(1518)-N(6)/adenine(1519)-N(6))-dimethyltransferase RsmA [Bergeyella sp.]|nr:16S rRNA (adenine(1518)-N(6)/adenine(1519)-N(6))-dimethyltransferase RsmA [Bergeyella sp.]